MDKIRHNGVIESIDGCSARVRIMRQSACSSCEARLTCHGHGVKDFHVVVSDASMERKRVGDSVVVEIPKATGRHAVMVGFVVPLVLVVASVIVAMAAGAADGVAAALALAVLSAFYCVLFMVRGQLERRFRVALCADADTVCTGDGKNENKVKENI